MTRAADLLVRLAGTQERTALNVFTYDNTAGYDAMRESVYLSCTFESGYTNHELTPAEARQLAAHLIAVAELCERARDSRHFDEDLEEQLRDPDSAINQGYAVVVRNGVVYGLGASDGGH
jgi:hypothetical protein